MKLSISTFFKQYRFTKKTRAFVIPLALLICTIILAVATGISTILTKEIFFSKLSRQSQIAYYAADNGMMCATMIDDTYVDQATGLGIFPSDASIDGATSIQNTLNSVNALRIGRGYSGLSLNSIKCATSDIFNAATTGFAVLPFSRVNSQGILETGKSSLFSMRMDLADGTLRCATVIVNKTPSYRQIISRGFSGCSGASASLVERAVISTTEIK